MGVRPVQYREASKQQRVVELVALRANSVRNGSRLQRSRVWRCVVRRPHSKPHSTVSERAVGAVMYWTSF